MIANTEGKSSSSVPGKIDSPLPNKDDINYVEAVIHYIDAFFSYITIILLFNYQLNDLAGFCLSLFILYRIG